MTMAVRRPRDVTRWDPMREFEQLAGQMNELMESTFGRGAAMTDGMIWAPPVDVEETEDAYVIDADVPGVKRDDVNVEVRDNELVISGEIKEQDRKGLLRRETRRKGRFEYRLILPSDVDADSVEARLDDGVLNIRVPKAAKAKPRRIEVSGK